VVIHYTTTRLEFIFIQYSNSKDVKQKEEHERKLRWTARRSNSLGWHWLSWLLNNPFKSGNVEEGECIILLVRNSKCYRSQKNMFMTTVQHMAPHAANPLSVNIISEMQ